MEKEKKYYNKRFYGNKYKHKKTPKLKTVSGDKLMSMELAPVRFVVKDLLPQGLNILAGQAKLGKSWLLLDLCLKVAKGDFFWSQETEKGTVLYLSLEDRLNRIKDRICKITDSVPPNIYLTVMAKSIRNGLERQIEMFIQDHPDTNLVVIDTLQKVRRRNGENFYAGDYKDISRLKYIADKHNISIVCVHHTNKKYSEDPFNCVSGSTGLTGAADNIYVLQKVEMTSPLAKLYLRGRDVEEREMTIRFDSEKFVWVIADESEMDMDNLMRDEAMVKLIDFITAEKTYEGTASELCERLDLHIGANNLSAKLRKYENALRAVGIEFTRERDYKGRSITLKYSKVGHDDDDDEFHTYTEAVKSA